MKLSVYTLACPEWSLSQCAEKIAEYGIYGVEWRVAQVSSNPNPDPRDPGRFWGQSRSTISEDAIEDLAVEVTKLSAGKGLEIIGLATSVDCKDFDKIERLMNAAKLMRTDQIRVGVGGLPKGALYDQAFDEAKAAWAHVAKLAEKTGVKANLEIHHGTLIPSASAARRFVQDLDPACVGLIYDPGNMAFEGFESYKLGLQVIAPWLSYVHVKNARPVVQGADGNRCLKYGYEWCPLRHGIVDWKSVLDALRDIGFDGWLSLEDFNSGTTPDQKLSEFVDLFGVLL